MKRRRHRDRVEGVNRRARGGTLAAVREIAEHFGLEVTSVERPRDPTSLHYAEGAAVRLHPHTHGHPPGPPYLNPKPTASRPRDPWTSAPESCEGSPPRRAPEPGTPITFDPTVFEERFGTVQPVEHGRRRHRVGDLVRWLLDGLRRLP